MSHGLLSSSNIYRMRTVKSSLHRMRSSSVIVNISFVLSGLFFFVLVAMYSSYKARAFHMDNSFALVGTYIVD